MTNALAYNGTIPGPMIDAKVGDTLIVHFTNNLGEPTTVHWHGVDTPADMDGSHISQKMIPDGGTFTYQFDLLTPGLKWYHPHVRTDYMVEHGLYGALLVRDPVNTAALGIQGHEHVIMFDDVKLDGTGQFDTFEPTDPLERAIYFLSGRIGDMLLVNGRDGQSISPLQLPNAEPQHWWVVNVSNSKFCRLDLNEYYVSTPAVVGDPVQIESERWSGKVWQIGGDRGLIPKRFERERVVEVIPTTEHFFFEEFRGILLTPGERMEVNFLPWGDDGEILPVDNWDWGRGDHIAFYMPDMVNIGLGDDPLDGFKPVVNYFDMQISGALPPPPYYQIPEDLLPIDKLEVADVTKTIDLRFGHALPTPAGDVTFFAQMVSGAPRPFPTITSLEAYDLEIGDVVLWEVNNLTHGDHPFHTHGFPFQWYERQYIDGVTPENNFTERPGRLQNKDTVLVPARPGAKGTSRTVLRALMEIDDTGREGQVEAAGRHPSSTTSGGWLAHCHVLEHAARGMMTFYEVRDPSSPFANLGGAFAGPAGEYGYLSGTGTIATAGNVTVELKEAAPTALAFLVVGFSEGNLPLNGGVFVPSGDLILGPFATNASGDLTKNFNWEGFGSGFQIWLQYLMYESASRHLGVERPAQSRSSRGSIPPGRGGALRAVSFVRRFSDALRHSGAQRRAEPLGARRQVEWRDQDRRRRPASVEDRHSEVIARERDTRASGNEHGRRPPVGDAARFSWTLPVAGAQPGAPLPATAAAATSAALRTRLGLVHAQVAPVELHAVQLLDRGLSFLVGRELGEREATRASGVAVHHEVEVLDVATVLREDGLQGVLGRVPGEVADVETLAHSRSTDPFERRGPRSARTSDEAFEPRGSSLARSSIRAGEWTGAATREAGGSRGALPKAGSRPNATSQSPRRNPAWLRVPAGFVLARRADDAY